MRPGRRRSRRPRPSTIRSSPSIAMGDAVGGEAGGDRGESVALLDAQLLEAVHPRSARTRTRQRRPGSGTRRSSRAPATPGRRRPAGPRAGREGPRHPRRPRRGGRPPRCRAPISISVVTRPMRDGFIITPSITMSEPGAIAAATIGNAAEDGSAGTTTGLGLSSGRPVEFDPSAVRAVRRATRTSRPEMASACARYGRASRSVSITVVSPGALRPASSTADLTCADGDRHLVGDRHGVDGAAQDAGEGARPRRSRRSPPPSAAAA